jgi:hypothetical protein
VASVLTYLQPCAHREPSDLRRQPSGDSSSSSSSSACSDPPLGRISVQVDVHGLGSFSFKGIDTPIHLTCVTPRMLSGRFDLYPRGLPTAKATLLKKGAGLLDTVTVELPDIRQMPFATQHSLGTRRSISWSPSHLSRPTSHQDQAPPAAANAAGSPLSTRSDSISGLQRSPTISMAARTSGAADEPLLCEIESAPANLLCALSSDHLSRAGTCPGPAPDAHPTAVPQRRHSSSDSLPQLPAPHRPVAVEKSAASVPAALGRPPAPARPAAPSSPLGRLRPFAASEDAGFLDLMGWPVQPPGPEWQYEPPDFSPRPILRSSTTIKEARKSGTYLRVQASSAAEIRSRQEASIQRSVGLVLTRTRPPEGAPAGDGATPSAASEAGAALLARQVQVLVMSAASVRPATQHQR